MRGKSRLYAAFVAVIQRHRRRRGLSQGEPADAAGVHRTYIGMPARIADALGEPLSELISEAERTVKAGLGPEAK